MSDPTNMRDRTPERIYGWLSSRLSIARFYGRIIFNDVEYVIAMDEDGHPLVRRDVKFPSKANNARKRVRNKDRKGVT